MPDDRAEGEIQVMEHRQFPRIGPEDRRFEDVPDPHEADAPRGWIKLSASPRLAVPIRPAIILIASLSSVGVVAYFGLRATQNSVAWLHRQSQYQLPFESIQLDPEPPPWFRGGRKAFLEGVRTASGAPRYIPILDLGPDWLATVFKHDAWVEDVSARYLPGRIIVRLRYRRPVAYVQLERAVQKVVDADGIVLPANDLDETHPAVKSLVKIAGMGLSAPADPRPGVRWKSEDGQNERRILAAAKLAAFFTDELPASTAERSPALHIIEVILTDFDRRGLFLLNAEGGMIWWRGAPDREAPGEPSAGQKWTILRRWAEAPQSRSLAEGDYWAFSRSELVPVCPHRGQPHAKITSPAGAGHVSPHQRKPS